MSTTSSAPEANSSAPAAKPRPRRSRWKRRVVWLMLLAVGLLAAAPMIVARTSLRERIVPWLFPEFVGTVTFESVSLSWFHPVRFGDVVIDDESDRRVASAQSLESSATLLELLSHPSELGSFTVRGMQLEFVSEPGTSNVERLLAPWLDGESSSESTAFELAFLDSTVTLSSSAGHSPSSVASERFVWKQTRDGERRIDANGSAATTPGETPGTLGLKAAWPKSSTGDWTGSLSGVRFPLSALQPLADRWGRSERVTGRWTGEWALAGTSDDGGRTFVTGGSTWEGLQIDRDGKRQLSLERAAVRLDAEAGDAGIKVKEFSAQSDFGQIALRGTAVLPAVAVLSDADRMFEHLLSQPLELTGEIDLPRMTRQFPGLLTLRDNVEILEGKTLLTLRSEPGPERSQLQAEIKLSKLVARTPQRQIVWDAPFSADFQVSRAGVDWTVDSLNVASRAINIRGRGNWSQAQLTANCDLAAFAREWGQVVDFGASAPTGTLTVQLVSKTTGENRIQLDAQLEAKPFSLGLPAFSKTFSQLSARGNAAGVLRDDGAVEWQSLSLAANTETERWSAVLIDPQAVGGETRVWKLDAAGSLAELDRILGLTQPGESIAGRYRLLGQVTQRPDEWQFADMDAQIQNFQWRQGVRRIDEQALLINGNLTYSIARGAVHGDRLTLTCETLAGRIESFAYQPEGPTLSGEIAARGRFERIRAVLDPAGEIIPPATGMLNLQLAAEVDAQSSQLRWNLFTENLQWLTASGGVPARPVSNVPPAAPGAAPNQMTCHGLAVIDRQSGTVTLREGAFDAGFLTATASGTWERSSPDAPLNLTGTCAYDWEVLSQRFPLLAANHLKITGKHESAFVATIPLGGEVSAGVTSPELARMSGGFELRWDSAELAGLAVGPAKLVFALEPGRLTMQPTELAVATGTMRLAPSMVFSPRAFAHPPGQVFDRVRLTEEICREWLQFVSPLTADATRVDGTFSLELLDHLQLVDDNPRASKGKGVLDIARAEMRPGPFAMQFVSLGRQIEAIRKGAPLAPEAANDPKTVLVIDQQRVPFEIRDGRVFHRDLRMLVRGLNVRTEGSVGFDDTLDLMASIDVPDDWTVRGKPVRDVWGASIRIPIRGTLKQPQMDGRIVQGLLSQLVKGSLNNLFEGELNKQLDKLFRPR